MDSKLLTVDLAALGVHEHPVVKRPQCAVCGDPKLLARHALAPIVLQSQKPRFTTDGGYRCVNPAETFARYRHHISPVTGILAVVEPGDRCVPPLRLVYGAGHPVVPEHDAPDFTDFHQTSAGKGRSPAQARTSALCEGLERYSSQYQSEEHRVRASALELGPAAILPNECMRFSDEQFRQRAPEPDGRRRVPEPFDPTARIDWTPLWSLTDSRHRYLPTAYCYGRFPDPNQTRFCTYDSNGHASGNCLEEAILQGFLELVERDAVALWWYNSLPRPSVALEAFGDAYFTSLHEHYRSMGWDLWALDLTADLEIPVFVALARRAGTNALAIGFGCHLDGKLALQRALTELNQTFKHDRRMPEPWEDTPLETQPYLFPDPAQPPRIPGDFRAHRDTDLQDVVLACVAKASERGLETLILDQTRPEVGLTAVKVAVPGLRHFWPRLGPGRLYDVPVAQGWLAHPHGENDLNQMPIFFF